MNFLNEINNFFSFIPTAYLFFPVYFLSAVLIFDILISDFYPKGRKKK